MFSILNLKSSKTGNTVENMKKKQKRMNTIAHLILMKTHGIVKMRMRNFLVLQIGKSPVRGIRRLSVHYPERRLILYFRNTDKTQPTILLEEITTWP